MMEAIIEKRNKIVEFFLNKNILITRDILNKINSEEHIEEFYDDLFNKKQEIVIDEFENQQQTTIQSPFTVKVIFDYDKKASKRTVQNFVSYFNARYKTFEKMLKTRQELQNLSSISRLLNKKERESASIIGIVFDKQVTKNNNYILTIEDLTGMIKVIVSKSKQQLYEITRDITYDEIIGVNGFVDNDVIFPNSIVLPDVPLQEIKKSPDEIYIAVIGCVHVGSNKFLKQEFENFLAWLNGDYGDEELVELSKKVGYIFVIGDLVDGIGIYPGQENELVIKDIYDQYKEAARYLNQIPKDKKIIIVPGNHDAQRLSEPQPKINELYAAPLFQIPNVIMLSNPGIVNIHSSEDFPGFDVLMYHGFSYSYYGDKIDGIRMSGKNVSERIELIMRYLLQKRHLAPSHKSTLYIPDPEKDSLIIEKVPDIFLSGHIHKSSFSNYRGVSLMSASCFQSFTEYQGKFGHQPDPGKIPLLNLQTRQVKLIDFGVKNDATNNSK